MGLFFKNKKKVKKKPHKETEAHKQTNRTSTQESEREKLEASFIYGLTFR